VNEREAKHALFEFRRATAGRAGNAVPAAPSDTGEIRELALARHLAVALLLEAEPHALEAFLDKLVWEADLSEQSLVAARYEAGLPQPVFRGSLPGFLSLEP
jgi:hypothetical protein